MESGWANGRPGQSGLGAAGDVFNGGFWEGPGKSGAQSPQAANVFFVGPASGNPALAAWRQVVIADLYPAAAVVVVTDPMSGTVPFDLSQGNVQGVVLKGNRTLTIANQVLGAPFNLLLTQDGTGSRTVTWFGGIRWSGGTVPTLTTTPNKLDVFSFLPLPAALGGGIIGMSMLNF